GPTSPRRSCRGGRAPGPRRRAGAACPAAPRCRREAAATARRAGSGPLGGWSGPARGGGSDRRTREAGAVGLQEEVAVPFVGKQAVDVWAHHQVSLGRNVDRIGPI